MNADHPNPNSTPGGLTDRQAELLSALADGELTGPELAEAQALLAGSPAAARMLEKIRQVSAAVRRMPAPGPAEPQEAKRVASAVLCDLQTLRPRVVAQPGADAPAAGRRARGAAWGFGLLATAAALLVMALNRGAILPWAERRDTGPQDVAIRPSSENQPRSGEELADKPPVASEATAARESYEALSAAEAKPIPTATGAFGGTTELAAESTEPEDLGRGKEAREARREPTIAAAEPLGPARGSVSGPPAEVFSYSAATPPAADPPSAPPSPAPVRAPVRASAAPSSAGSLADGASEEGTPLEGVLRESVRYFDEQQGAAVGDSLLVLRVSTVPEALANNHFARILAENRLALTELRPLIQQNALTQPLADAAKPRSAAEQSASLAAVEQSPSAVGAGGGSLGIETKDLPRGEPRTKLAAAQAELVLIDAPQIQIDGCVEMLRRDVANFRSIEVLEEPLAALGRGLRRKASPINQTEGTQLRFAEQQLRRLNAAGDLQQGDNASRFQSVDLLTAEPLLSNQPLPRMLLAAPMEAGAGVAADGAKGPPPPRRQALFFFSCPPAP